MIRDELKKRLNLSHRRNLKLYQHIGLLSTYFSSLELQLIEVLAKCINPNSPDRVFMTLSQLSFRQCVNVFRQTIPKFFPKRDIITYVKQLANRLDDVSSRRNEFIHSSWIAYSTGDYGQHRARVKNNLPLGPQVHPKNPKKLMDDLIDEIDQLLFDLICLEDELKKIDSKKSN